MSHLYVDNESGLAFDSLFLSNESGVPVFVPLLQATCAILADGRVGLRSKQPAVNVAGEWYGDPATSSLKLEPQIAFMKPATDVVLLGHAYPSKPGGSEGQVGIRVGPVQKVARVWGDRMLVGRVGPRITPAAAFEKIPLVYERSFGGWDRRHAEVDRHRCEARNPVGVGFRDPRLGADDEVPLPNFEDPNRPFSGYGDAPPPAGFGFIQASWQPRVSYAGTYDEAWEKTRKPLLPADFDRRFFNSAPPGLIAPGYLEGNEQVVVIGATPEGRFAFNLPDIAPSSCLVEMRGGQKVTLQTVLDTVIVDMDARALVMIWRAYVTLRNGPHDVVAVIVDPQPEPPDEVEDVE
jgi:hypothetical protein